MNVHVLFVDDEEPNLVVWKAACAAEFHVLTATNADAALEKMRAHEVGVLLSDQRMPGASGVDLLERVRDEFPDTIRILITAYSDLHAAIDAINRGQVRRYLRKPCKLRELRAELADGLDLYRLKTTVRAMERRLVETERVYSLGLIVAGLAHELRNPIGVVSNNVDFAREGLRALANSVADDAPANKRHVDEIAEIEAALGDAAGATQRTMDILSGIELPTRSTEVALVDVAEVIRLTLQLVRGELSGGVTVDVDAPAALKVRGSATKLGQVTLNLILNAIQAAATAPRDRKKVNVHLRGDGASVRIEVVDRGAGIAAADLTKIFDPFFTTKSQGGTGLGLAISRKIIEEMGGQVEASNHPQGGAIFCVVLPAGN